ncbi:helicase-exonuclease AddAB subunit AddA [Virgibacillus pantothenticus]|uniref:ATP-dependent helicase/nuclease subunit A n=1 Tax=Virgibacillus pantothenticus TaxID=1473 RepID=A0A0L0QTR5_VIRPA|nr:helicase-exonuclease AddAB subunit AddA [Virgibacillus pantothenticus]KNE21994.1 ATP-dependent helicase [Virgibacillus pantothenticus]MED3736113.1 helicase-exonuclease AddAB subunit AddA [Virgibacillus pantothenticus]QTY17237.1 helicase-exonuclease AddAB subunit AddA [Virgibacillus pantothenticus]SIS94674.1 DNA helicase/exodeoxyribonuclease V, subunit A [Virgibacillus pantothenticus]
MVSWTKEQEEAIYTKGSDILVAAAAGSGKTAVLVERIIQKLLDKENPVDIDSLLVVTFTNAAAQEMRNRVGAALEKALEENPASLHLKKQLSLLQRASISTLHAFCLDVVKQYAYLLDVDPAFRIANDIEAELIKQEVLDDLFEGWYGATGTEQEEFFQVVDRFSNDRSDADVETLILQLYDFAVKNPWPDQWLDGLAEAYDIPENMEESELSWLSILKREVREQLRAMEQEIQQAMDITRESDGPYHYAETIEQDLTLVQEARRYLNDWQQLHAWMEASTFAKLSGKKAEVNEEKKKQVKKLRDNYKKRWTNMKRGWFTRNLASHLDDMREMAPVMKQLASLVKAFKSKFQEEKKERALVDFSDLEHLCLQVLMEDGTFHAPIPSKVATNFQRQFTEILIDEYQDTNLVQETILSLISDQIGAGNRFMVGDVKQSIYRFRHAEPSLFIKKYNRFAQSEHLAKRIDLSRNFRSRSQVLTGTNYLFRQIIDESLGEINYDENAELIYGNKIYDAFPLAAPNPELIIIDRETDEKTETAHERFVDLEKAELEARIYARKIKQWIGQEDGKPLQVVDKKTQQQRDVQYRDIVILLRSMTDAPVITDELKKQGIPVYAELSAGYFAAIEVKVMISFLKVVDNPRQDIPLAAVLRSPIVGLSEEELTTIRLARKKQVYYDALTTYAKENTGPLSDKIALFLNQLRRYRSASRQGALSELIWKIYRETAYYDYVGGMPGGRQRQANLRALYDRARTYEMTSFRGLFRFLRFIERMEERGDDLGAARALSEQEDVVRIMTIHKSKGLEFPIVLLGGLDKQFNLSDLNKKYLLHKDYGFASKYIDPVKRISYPTLYYHALKQEMLRDQLAEEMRVLYVALTRAKEKLVMVGNVASFEKKQEKWESIQNHPDWVLPTYSRIEAKTYLDWVAPALLRHHANDVLRLGEIGEQVDQEIQQDPSGWDIHILHASELVEQDDLEDQKDDQLYQHISDWRPFTLANEQLGEAVQQRLNYTYPYIEAAKSRAKQTVTELKRQQELKDEYSSDQLITPFQRPIVRRPAFMQKEKKLSAAEKGTIVHKAMQHLPLDRILTAAEIEEELEKMVEKEIIGREAVEQMDLSAIEHFYQTPIAQAMIMAPYVQREVPFSLTLPAPEVYPNWQDDEEQVLIQGVIDAIFPKEDGWIILDYKTDMIHGEWTKAQEKKMLQRYQTQMKLYRHAVQTIWKQPVLETYLYFFTIQELVRVP